MSLNTVLAAVEDMLLAARDAVDFLGGADPAGVKTDRKTAAAVVNALTVLGEACKRVPKDVKDRFPDVPWRDVARTRDRLIHGYHAINFVRVWQIVTVSIPELLPPLELVYTTLLAEEPPPPEIPADDR